MQKGYRYEVVEPIGRKFDSEFRPELTPAEMLRLGVFGGKYAYPNTGIRTVRPGAAGDVGRDG